jgi:hypothetical protein
MARDGLQQASPSPGKWCKVFKNKDLCLDLHFASGIKSLFSRDGLRKVFGTKDLILSVNGLFWRFPLCLEDVASAHRRYDLIEFA